MYNTKVICTYNTDEIFQEDDNINDDDKDFVRDAIYRQEFLNILGIEEFDDKLLDKSIHELYEKIKNCKDLRELMLKIAGRWLIEDEEIGLMMLYSFDFMYVTHKCVSEYLETSKISDINLNELKTLI
jgi:hypothetical protein